MYVAIVTNTNNELQRRWLDRLMTGLRDQGHDPHVWWGESWLHQESLHRICVADRFPTTGRVVLLDWDHLTFPGWEESVERGFADEKVVLVSAEHAWRRLDIPRDEVAEIGVSAGWPGELMHYGNTSAWFTAVDLDRLRAIGMTAGDLDWNPDPGPGLEFHYAEFEPRYQTQMHGHRVTHTTGRDSGGRLPIRVEEAGGRVALLDVHLAETTHGLLTCDRRVYHHVYGRHMGESGTYDVLAHFVSKDEVTRTALDVLRGGEIR